MTRHSEEGEFARTPNTIPWPPLLLICAIAAAVLLQMTLPLALMPSQYVRAFGAAIALAGLALDLSAIVAMRAAQANILPHRPATRLVTGGPFRFTRNPIYLGNVLLCGGLALLFANAWLCATGALMAFAVDRLAIRREEVHLAHRFGLDWERYKNATPRWLLL